MDDIAENADNANIADSAHPHTPSSPSPPPSPPLRTSTTPNVPRLVFAEGVEQILRVKSKENYNQDSNHTPSESERRSERERFEEALKGTQWDIGSSSDALIQPFSLQASPSHSPTVSSLQSTPKRPLSSGSGTISSGLLSSSSGMLSGISSSSSRPSTPSRFSRMPRNEPLEPTIEAIPQVVPKLVPTPERLEEHGPQFSELAPPTLPSHFESEPPSHRAVRTLVLCMVGILLLPIVYLVFVVSLPIAQHCCDMHDNLVYLLAYQPAWSLVVGFLAVVWTGHQLSIINPESLCIGIDTTRQVITNCMVIVFAVLVSGSYAAISAIVGEYPVVESIFVIIPPLAILLIVFYFTIANSEGRALPGFSRNYLVHMLALLLLQIHLAVMIPFTFFFPQVGTFIQVVIACLYHMVTLVMIWIINYALSKFTFKSIDKYKKPAGTGKDFNNRSNYDLKSTINQTVLKSFLSSRALTSQPSTATLPPLNQETIINPDLSTSSLQYFFVNLQGFSFWPVFFLPYTDWESFALQLAGVLVISSFYSIRLTNFWFHFSAKGQASNRRKLWNVAELATKVEMVEYRKKVCAEFAFYYMASILSLLAFILLQFVTCASYNAKEYNMCLYQADKTQAIIFAAISLVGLGSLLGISLFLLRKYSRQRLHVLFGPWRHYVTTHFWLLVVLATGSLVYPYYFSVAHNHMIPDH